jgi:L-phenylalanine/L-methionine N-acetyltransferase
MIRKAKYDDLDFIFKLYMHPVSNPWLLYEVMEKHEFESIFNDLLSKRIVYVYEEEGIPIGMFKLIRHTYRTSHVAYLGGLAIDPDFSGKGKGLKLVQEIIDFAKQNQIFRIELSAATINERAIHLYKKAGFVEEGILKKYTYFEKENKYLDEVLMAYVI